MNGAQVVFQMLVDLEDRGLVAAAVAVVGSAEDGDCVAVVAPCVPFHGELVGAGDQHEPILLVKLLRYVLTKRVARTPGRDAPTAPLIRIGPEQVAHGTLMRDLTRGEGIFGVGIEIGMGRGVGGGMGRTKRGRGGLQLVIGKAWRGVGGEGRRGEVAGNGVAMGAIRPPPAAAA